VLDEPFLVACAALERGSGARRLLRDADAAPLDGWLEGDCVASLGHPLGLAHEPRLARRGPGRSLRPESTGA